MEVVLQTIRIIDYENNMVYVREAPETFSDYVRQLITYLNFPHQHGVLNLENSIFQPLKKA